MEFVPLVAALLFVQKIVDLIKYLKNGDVNGVVTQLVTWLAGVGVMILLAQTDFASGITIGNLNLGLANGYSLILIGLTVSSGASVAYDFKKARDNTDSATTPSLVGSSPVAYPPQD